MNPIYDEYHVNGDIANFIKKLWILDNPENHPPLLNKGVPPNGCLTMAIIQGNGLHIRHKDHTKRLSTGVYFCGQITETLFIDVLSGTKATMIQLFPWTPAYFGFSDAHLFTDNICVVNEVALLKTLDLHKMMGSSNRLVCQYLAKSFAPLYRTNVTVDLIFESTQLIMTNKGNITVASIATSMNCSERHLQKLFKNFVGISPKLFINIIKLREALDDIVYPIEKPLTMTQLAVSNGYYDQSHFNNTFASFTGTTPKNFKEKEFFLTIKK